ncbi:hypothetical protein HHK36_029229 [Tetracentron sinense]|uniref:Uncharacterized protein n=1 Tax=Tetracentron sinense TaxID=13715 RepID=A0A835D1E3_TETSI|nr:hypothetical protein HHK36_029229 [Tetracentron sinense]
MASVRSKADERAGAEIVFGSEACYRHSIELLEELGFPKGVLPSQDLEECGRVHETGFVWMKQKAPREHVFVGTNTRVSYATEVTAFVEKFKMKKMTGIKSKQVLLWVPITEMSMEDPASQKIHFKTPVGIGRSFPITAFMTDEEKQQYLEKANAQNNSYMPSIDILKTTMVGKLPNDLEGMEASMECLLVLIDDVYKYVDDVVPLDTGFLKDADKCIWENPKGFGKPFRKALGVRHSMALASLFFDIEPCYSGELQMPM